MKKTGKKALERMSRNLNSQTALVRMHNAATALENSLVVPQKIKHRITMKSSEVKSLSRVRLSAIPWAIVYQASLSMGFSRQEYWGGLPFPSPGDRPDPRLEHVSPMFAGRFFTTEPSGKPRAP